MEQGLKTIGSTAATTQEPPEASPSSVGGSLAALGLEIRDAVQGAGTAVGDTAATFKTAVGETAGAVTGVWQEGISSLGHALDLRRHVREHPWPMLAGAALLGFGTGTLIRRLRR